LKTFNKLSQKQRKKIQVNLKYSGFYKLSLNSLFVEETVEALTAFNKQNLDESDLKKLENVNNLITTVLALEKAKSTPQTKLEEFTEEMPVIKASDCDNSPEFCSAVQLCNKATSKDKSGTKFWREGSELIEYVMTAKDVGLTCGVDQAPMAVTKYLSRKALVIGNANYINESRLKNPINDARAIASKLEKLGFDVVFEQNLGRRKFLKAIDEFRNELIDSDISLFYFAGHGIELNKENYLIPVDAELDSITAIKYDAIALDDAIEASLKARKLSMVLIDACRDNRFLSEMKLASRSLQRGLTIVETRPGRKNQIISFAAESGKVALDGTGRNSPYARALIGLLDEPNLEVGKLFRLLGDRVYNLTGGQQTSVTRNNLSGEDIYLLVE
ncbi:caspase family protein, partial [Paracoccaceae bacterium]|nr:caspase family protein [Paracoccaceae bacterium]